MNVKGVDKKSWMVLSNTVVNPIDLFTADQTIHNRDDILVTRDVYIDLFYKLFFLYSIFPIHYWTMYFKGTTDPENN